ncbi:iron-dependent peroxidase [Paenibacillus sp. FSL W8-0919]|uniref:iron-dependent peroxidase n=1 Tax=Paenibacillus sp. FSL W8-0919 TaxID=2954707 RepID=UPI0030F78E44
MGVNYIWDFMIEAERSGWEKRDVVFEAARIFSPYMELSPYELNASIEQRVEMNPLYRFDDILGGLADMNLDADTELREALFDIVVHFLADIDRMQGMNRREFYIQFVLRDIREGRFGKRIQEHIQLFGREEQEWIARNVLQLHETGEALHWYKDTLRMAFPSCIVYSNCETQDEIIAVLGVSETPEGRCRADLIRDLFLPLRFHLELYWERHFGIIGIGDTMAIGSTALY